MTKIIAIRNNPAIFYILLSSIVLSAAIYVYCVNSAVRNTVARGKAEQNIAELQTQVSELEYEYRGMENRMTIESAGHLGLYEPSQKIFISKNGSTRPLSLYNRE